MKKNILKFILPLAALSLMGTSCNKEDPPAPVPQDEIFPFARRDFLPANLESTKTRLLYVYNNTTGRVLLSPAAEPEGWSPWTGMHFEVVDYKLDGITQGKALSPAGNIIIKPGSKVTPNSAFCDVIAPWGALGLEIIPEVPCNTR